MATSRFLWFYFLTLEGLDRLGDASPGGAGRNRTLGREALSKLLVPVPRHEQQLWFDSLQERVAQLAKVQDETELEIDLLLPAILDRAFRGAL